MEYVSPSVPQTGLYSGVAGHVVIHSKIASSIGAVVSFWSVSGPDVEVINWDGSFIDVFELEVVLDGIGIIELGTSVCQLFGSPGINQTVGEASFVISHLWGTSGTVDGIVGQGLDDFGVVVRWW